MGTGTWFSGVREAFAARIGGQRARWHWLLSSILLGLGVLFLLAAIMYAVYVVLNTRMMEQDHFLRAPGIAAMPVLGATWTPSPVPAPTLRPSDRLTLTPNVSPSPRSASTAEPTVTIPSPPVQIRIPALGVTRSIVKLSRIPDSRTGAWTWKTKSLFRAGRKDLVGHWEGSAYPGQAGNMILVGHNYGYGFNGVFVALGRLKSGQKVHVVDQAGQRFSYEVKSVNRVKWRKKDFGELTRHLSFLSPGGPERVTLVSCAGAELEPFPERIYVVAEPVR